MIVITYKYELSSFWLLIIFLLLITDRCTMYLGKMLESTKIMLPLGETFPNAQLNVLRAALNLSNN